jgi:RNA polymerase sigma factor (sigma-70 family)
LIRRWRRAAAQVEELLGRIPTQEEICEHMALSRAQRKRLAEGLRFLRTPAFSDLGDETDIEHTLTDDRSASPEIYATRTETIHQLSRLLERLDKKEATVLRRRFGLHGRDPQTYRSISAELGLGCKRVRRMEQRGMRRLRGWLAGHV